MSLRRISPQEMACYGWERIDPRPWSKCAARWKHRDGWTLTHCGHPTALFPWILKTQKGRMILTGVKYGKPPTFGTCWPTLAEAADYVASQG